MNSLLIMDDTTYISQNHFTEHVMKYFSINSYEVEYTRHISEFVRSVQTITNEGMSFTKLELMSFLKGELVNLAPELSEVYISSERVNISDIEDIFEKKIFQNYDCETQGWLVWIDPCKLANWSHSCEYWFIVNLRVMYKSMNEKWMPSSNIQIDKIIL